jgi:hypothetical protein
MYQNLCDLGKNYIYTDDKKYPCPSLPSPNAFPSYSSTSYYNREYYLPPIDELTKPTFNPTNLNLLQKTDIVPPIQDADYMGYVNKELYKTNITPHKNDDITSHKNDDYLLPVLDCRFNLREICKQCILLEDHLSHDKKRCYDCCIKHFLALEGLSEEAITLDKEGKYYKSLKDIPDNIRAIQKLWYQNPQKNSHQASQLLRQLRKKFMQNSFNIIFDSQNNENMCNGGLCKIKK